MKYLKYLPALVLASLALPAAAQEEEPPKEVTVSGSIGLVSDYRFRGVSQSDKELAVQGGITIAHESGFYVGTWGSNLAGWGTFGGSNTELDLIGGFKTEITPGVSVDVGLTWYMYPGGADKTDFAEPYVKVSGTAGPVNLLVGVAYAPAQEALGRWSFTGANAQDVLAGGPYDDAFDKEDNFYVWADASTAIPNTPLTLKAHVGWSDGNPGLGPNGTSVAPTGKYLDYMIGADFAIPSTPLTLGVAFVDTDISAVETYYLQPNFSSSKDGSRIDTGRVIFSITAAF